MATNNKNFKVKNGLDVAGTTTSLGDLVATEGDITASRSSGPSPVIDVAATHTAGFTPPTIRFQRTSAGYTVTPDNQSLGLFIWATRDTTDTFQTSALIEVTGGVNTINGITGTTIQLATQNADGWPTVRLSVNNTAITATVPVVLPADPTTALQAATKQYVDANAGGGLGNPNYVQDTAPSSPPVVYTWWDTSDGNLTLWIEDGT